MHVLLARVAGLHSICSTWARQQPTDRPSCLQHARGHHPITHQQPKSGATAFLWAALPAVGMHGEGLFRGTFLLLFPHCNPKYVECWADKECDDAKSRTSQNIPAAGRPPPSDENSLSTLPINALTMGQ